MATIFLPSIIEVGARASTLLPNIMGTLKLSKPLIITDPGMVAMGYAQDLLDTLATAQIPTALFADCVPDPTTEAVASAVSCWKAGDYDCLVALGGGSSIDTAKAASVLAMHGGHLQQYKAPNPVPKGFPVIAIPTTAGTGSEVTRVTVVTDSETQEKMMCLGQGLLPVAALVDYELTLSMPFRLTADTGLDTLCHALEAYVSKKANRFTDDIALACLRSVAAHLETACHSTANTPENLAAREAMMLAATQGGIAFSNASVTLIHGMSRPLGAFFHIPHGMSNAMLLPLITQFSVPGATQRYAECARTMNMANATDSDNTACDRLIKALSQLCGTLKVPTLQSFGVDKDLYFERLDIMAEQALASGSPANNPVVPSHQEIVALYRQLWV